MNRPLPGLGSVRRRGRNQRAPLDTERRRLCRRFDPSGLGAFVLAAVAKAVRRVKGPLRQVALRARGQLAKGLIRFDDDDDEELQRERHEPKAGDECNEWIRFVEKIF